jgi:hypothetical protein
MSYQSETQLANDQAFQHRVSACCTQQADTFKDDARADFVALANSVLRVEGKAMPSFYAIAAAAPGFADDVDQGDGTIDSSVITDLQILAVVQNNWQVIAGLYFDDTGAPIT